MTVEAKKAKSPCYSVTFDSSVLLHTTKRKRKKDIAINTVPAHA